MWDERGHSKSLQNGHPGSPWHLKKHVRTLPMAFPRAAGLRTSTVSEAPKIGLFLLLLVSAAVALAHGDDGNSSAKYQQAVAEKQTGRRILSLEEFVSANPNDPLRADALEL